MPAFLRAEYLVDPLALDNPAPRLTWLSGVDQSAYQVVVDGLWDSGRVEGRGWTRYGGPALAPGQRAVWRVRCWDGAGLPTDWSEDAWWEAGPASWDQATWTGPGPLLRRRFAVPAMGEARLYATALGLYEARINGKRVSPDCFAPGWTDYDKRVAYQAYDVGALLQPGENVIDVELADGWYAGWLGFLGKRSYWGEAPAFMAQLVVDGAVVLVTDEQWESGRGGTVRADFLMGEEFDARVEPSGWAPAAVMDVHPGRLVSTLSPLPRVTEELQPVSAVERAPGVWLYDMGQNMVGWARIRVQGESGTRVVLRFAEMLEPDGSLHTANLRKATSVDEYVLRGDGIEEWAPRFTFHGFRYVEVSGIRPHEVVGVVCGSPLRRTGEFECSDGLVNQLQRNIVWGQRGNFLEVPTDCPQRDERLGWMGDAQVFGATACFNMDVASFFTKWMHDVVDAQTPEGAFPDVAPKVVDTQDGMPGWGDAGVIVPWLMYERYGDTAVLEEHFDAMARWVGYIADANPDGLWRNRRNGDVGDWLSIDADSPKDVVATSFFALSADLVGRMARVVGRDPAPFEALAASVRAAYREAFVHDDGRIEGDTQAVYALAIRFALLEDDAVAGELLAADVAARGDKLSTGFLGTPHLLPALTMTGHLDTAYRLLHQTDWPSWLYPVRHGATTIWERWNGWTEEHGLHEPSMNSFNHYAFGSVGEWLYETVAGLRADTDRPGFEHFFVVPHPGGGLRWVSLRYDSIRGPISVRWEGERLDVSVPPNTSATVVWGETHEVGPGRHSFRRSREGRPG